MRPANSYLDAFAGIVTVSAATAHPYVVDQGARAQGRAGLLARHQHLLHRTLGQLGKKLADKKCRPGVG